LIYIPEERKIIDSLFPEYLAGNLDKETRHADYVKLIEAINVAIREARRNRLQFQIQRQCSKKHIERPEDFLLIHFHPILKQIIARLLNKFKSLPWEEFESWRVSAELIFRSMVLGEKTPIGNDIEDRLLENRSRRFDAHKDKLLGRKKRAHKEEFHARFYVDSPETEDIATAHAARYRPYSKKQNPYFDEPAVFDPDYKAPELRKLINEKSIADLILEEWKAGELPNCQTEFQCLDWIKSNCLNGKDLNEINRLIEQKEVVRKNSPPDFIVYVRGKGHGSKNQGFLYERLRQLANAEINHHKRQKSAEALWQDEELNGEEIDEAIHDDSCYVMRMRSQYEMLWNEEESKKSKNSSIIHISPDEYLKKN